MNAHVYRLSSSSSSVVVVVVRRPSKSWACLVVCCCLLCLLPFVALVLLGAPCFLLFGGLHARSYIPPFGDIRYSPAVVIFANLCITALYALPTLLT